jgi:NADPH:quinone reductase-like Zn-dependent oxidoreductase
VGANARHICLTRDQVVAIPDELKDDKKVACLPEIYLGAFQALHLGQKNGARYRKTSLNGKSILILGGATILGKALIELCHSAGAHAIYGTGKERHFPIIEAARATPISRDPCHWYSFLKGRIDLVVGLDNDTFEHSEASAQHLEVLSPNGRAVLFGAPECSCDAKIDNKKKIYVYNVFDSWEKDLKQCKRDLSHLCKLMLEGSIDPQILETLSLSQIADVHDTVENRDFSSFLLCDPWMQNQPAKTKALSPPGIQYTKERTRRKRHSLQNSRKKLDPLPGTRPIQGTLTEI